MARFPDYQPQLRVVNSVGTPIEGPYRLDVLSGAEASRGLVLGETEPWYEEESIGPFLNYQWAEVAYSLGYRYFVRLNFAKVEALASSTYGLTLLDRLYQIAVQNQVTYAALQFSLFVGAPFFGVRPSGGGFHPTKLAGKQGLYELSLSFKSRDLQASPQPWAVSQW